MAPNTPATKSTLTSIEREVETRFIIGLVLAVLASRAFPVRTLVNKGLELPDNRHFTKPPLQKRIAKQKLHEI